MCFEQKTHRRESLSENKLVFFQLKVLEISSKVEVYVSEKQFHFIRLILCIFRTTKYIQITIELHLEPLNWSIYSINCCFRLFRLNMWKMIILFVYWIKNVAWLSTNLRNIDTSYNSWSCLLIHLQVLTKVFMHFAHKTLEHRKKISNSSPFM